MILRRVGNRRTRARARTRVARTTVRLAAPRRLWHSVRVIRPIRIIITGGTFDKQYDEIRGELTLRMTHLPHLLERVRITVPVEIEINQLVDSLHMDDDGRARVAHACGAAPERQIIVTHGTDTMAQTAELIRAARLDKTIVLTGAMIPYVFSGSDAEFNLGCAFGAVQSLPTGVYIAMNGRVFASDRVTKDRERGFFVDVNEHV